MTRRRTADEHVRLFATYAARVSALAAPAWERLEARCARLSDPSFAALLARASLTAKSHELWIPRRAESNRKLWAIKRASDVIQHGFAFAAEVFAEFETVDDSASRATPGTPKPGSRNLSPRAAALFEADRQLETALAPRAHRHPGVASAIRAAGHAVLRHDFLTPEDLSDLYQYVEDEIPFASLGPA
jgi:hypothetical protein